jgi:hypothetical protein
MYLGVVFNESGSFTTSKHEIHNKGNKTLFKLRKTFWDNAPKVTTFIAYFLSHYQTDTLVWL